MPVLAGALVTAPSRFGGGQVTSDLSVIDTRWAPGASLMASQVSGTLSRTMADSASRSLVGAVVKSFQDDFYNRIHVRPLRLDVGNVATAQTFAATIWNAYLTEVSLTAIEALNTEGITLTGPVAPLTVAPLRELVYQVALALQGPPQADARLLWHFAGLPDAELPITASRIIPFAWAPDWAGGIRERLSWLTTVFQSPTVREQRRALRLAPRRTFTAPVLVEGQDRQSFDLALWGWGARVWAMPVWHDVQLLSTDLSAGALSIACSTTGREFKAGGLALLRGPSAQTVEVVEIDSVGAGTLNLVRPVVASWAKGARLYPVLTARLEGAPAMARLHDQATRAEVVFRVLEPVDVTAAPPATLYRGWPVFSARPEESEDLTLLMQRVLQEMDNGMGTATVEDFAGQAFLVQGHRWVLGTRSEHSDLRGLLYHLQGRFQAVWLPTFADDLTLLGTITSAATAMSVANVGYTRFAGTAPGRRDIRIELKGGGVYHRRITGAIETSATAETLSFDTALGVAVGPSDIRRISFMALCRLDQDDIELLHETDADGITTCSAVFRSVRDEL